MNFQYMREFVALVETRNYLEAADQLFISQATLSRHIMAIEKELGGQLFHRTTRKIELTDLGARFLPYAKKAIILETEYQNMVRKLHNMEEDTLKIGVMEHWSDYPILPLLAEFRQEYPNVVIDIQSMKNALLLENLAEEKCNLAFIREIKGSRTDGIQRITLYEDQLAVYLPAGHKLSKETEIEVWQLKNEIFLLPEKNSLVNLVCNQLCRESGFEPKYSFKGLGHMDMVQLMKKGYGVGILVAPGGNPVPISGRVSILLKYSNCISLNLVYRENRLHSVERKLVDFFAKKQSVEDE